MTAQDDRSLPNLAEPDPLDAIAAKLVEALLVAYDAGLPFALPIGHDLLPDDYEPEPLPECKPCVSAGQNSMEHCMACDVTRRIHAERRAKPNA